MEFVTLLIFLVGFALYFIPSIIALINKHPHGVGIFLLNLFTGWTFFGWVGAIVWAVTKPRSAAVEVNASGGGSHPKTTDSTTTKD